GGGDAGGVLGRGDQGDREIGEGSHRQDLHDLQALPELPLKAEARTSNRLRRSTRFRLSPPAPILLISMPFIPVLIPVVALIPIAGDEPVVEKPVTISVNDGGMQPPPAAVTESTWQVRPDAGIPAKTIETSIRPPLHFGEPWQWLSLCGVAWMLSAIG